MGTPVGHRRAVDDLLKRADSLSLESMIAAVSQLPETFQDSFFLLRFVQLEQSAQLNGAEIMLTAFQKTRPGALSTHLGDFYQGVFSQYAGKFDSAELCYARAAKGFEAMEANKLLAITLDSRSGNLIIQGQRDEAIAMKYRAIALLKETGDTRARMVVQKHLANAFSIKGEVDQCLALLEEPIAYAEADKDTSSLAYMMAIKGSVYIWKKDFANALHFHQKALGMRQRIGATSEAIESQFHVGRVLLRMNEWQTALDTLRAAEKALRNNPDKQGKAFIESGIGEALFYLGRYQEAEDYLAGSLDLSVQRGQHPAAASAAQRLSTVRKKQKRFEEALRYHEQYLSFKDSVFNQEKDKISRELNIKHEIHEKELKISALQRENELAKQRNWWVGGLLLLISGVGFYAFVLHSQREKNRSEAEQAKNKAQNLMLQQRVDAQNIELTARRTRLEDYAKMLIERNQQLSEFKMAAEQAELMSEQSALSDQLYNQIILTDADWEKFQQYFNQVNPGFIARLRSHYPELTPAETRLVLLDKMGLSLKESSSILGISLDAVKKGRYRLKKKYRLDSEELSSMT